MLSKNVDFNPEDRIYGRRLNSFLFLALDDLEVELTKLYTSIIKKIHDAFGSFNVVLKNTEYQENNTKLEK